MLDVIHGARVYDDLVLLDLEAGDYSLLPGLFGAAAGSADARLEAVTQAIGRALPAGLAAALQEGFGPVPNASQVATGAPDGALQVTLRDRRDFAASVAGLVRGYWGRSLAHLVGEDRLASAGADGDLLRRCRSFARLLPWAPFPGACLYRAYLLRAFLARGGLGADWVFGVRTWPFRAHCWLACEGVVLNDDPQRTALFTPILVV